MLLGLTPVASDRYCANTARLNESGQQNVIILRGQNAVRTAKRRILPER